MSEKEKGRFWSVDLLRILSMFMIVILHVLSRGGVVDAALPGTRQYTVSWGLLILVFPAVNVFAMISGYVGWKSRFKLGAFLRIWLETFFYSLGIYLAFRLRHGTGVDYYTWQNALFPVISEDYWYITAYFGVLLFQPVMNAFIQTCSKKLYTVVMVLVLFVFTVPTTFMNQHWVFGLADGYSMLWLCTLYLLGVGIAKFYPKTKSSYAVLAYILSAAVLIFAKGILEPRLNPDSFLYALIESNISYLSPLVVINAMALFYLCLQIKIENKAIQKVIGIISPLTLGVYLIHVNPIIFQHYLTGRFQGLAGLGSFQMVGAVFLAASFIFVVCLGIDYCREKLFRVLRIQKLCQVVSSVYTAIE